MITIDVTKGIEAAEAKRKAAGLSAQKNGGSGGCFYRDDNGCPCYIGAMISDDDWDREIKDKKYNDDEANGMFFRSLHEAKVFTITGIPEGYTEAQAKSVLDNLQGAHDEAANSHERPKHLRGLSAKSRQALEWTQGGPFPDWAQ